MHNMEDGIGSADGSSDVIKKKSSSGCLIIKKKGNGVLGFGGSGSKKVFESRNEKKRSRLVGTDSGSSDELEEPVRRKVTEDIIYERRRSGIDAEDAMMHEFGSERKRSGLDVFEFDEYDGFDGKKMRTDYMDDRLKGVGRSGNHRDFGVGASRNVVYRSEDMTYERKGSMSGVKSKGIHSSGKSRYEVEDDDDESHLPISFLKEKCREAPSDPIRLQGKNGVLKVMVKKKKQGFLDKGSEYPRVDERMSSRSEAAIKKNEVIKPAFYSDSKRPGKPVSLKTEKSYKKSRKVLPVFSSKAEDSETDDSEKSLKQESTSKQAQRSKKAIKSEHKKTTNEHKRSTPTEILTTPSGGKESKVTRGNGTEKQLLREKIRSMLLDRGWRIDYRPRRNRDYLDAVYISPAGTAYWSIIKAYDALQKQLEEEEDNIKPCGESTSSTALPEEIISKLTRQTRKKIERDLKKKRDAGCTRSAKEVTMRESANGTDSDQQEEKLSSYMKQNHKSLKGRFHEADYVNGNDSSDSLYKRKAKQDMAEKQSATDSHMIQGRKSKKIGRCTLLVRSSDKGLNSETDGYVPYTGKRTLLSWLIDSGIVHMSEKVQYMNRRKTRVMLEGWITKDGIHCGCCSKILAISKFEIHAGSKQRQPFPNMYLESGLSLMQCQIDAWNKQEESEREGFHNVDVDGDDPNDDTCGLCGDGGDLICCDGCPSTFHQSCLDIKMLPAGDWHCPNCTCKFCGFAGSSAKANDRTDNSLLLCSLCEKKYHQSCSRDEVDLSADSGSTANSFCGKNCQEIFSHLQKLLGVKQELGSGFSWSLVHRMDPASETLHLGFPQRIECDSKLAVALSVMDECFLPIVDRRSGINLIHKVLYNCGSNFSRLNYSGFYTAILERGDEIMSVASMRIHGNQLAEMPFIGTRHIYRRQGMCRRLLSAIKSALRTLKVEKLIIPAIAEHMHTWTKNFKFSPLKESHKQEMRSMNMLVFPRTDMLQKLLVKQEIMEGSITNNSGSQSTEVKENSLLLPVLGEKSELYSSPEHEPHMSDNAELQPLTESSNKATVLVSASETPTLASNDIPAISSSLVSSREPKHEPAMEETPAINSLSVNNLAESTVNLKSTSPSNEHPSTIVADSAVLGPSVRDHTQSSADDVVTDALEKNAKAASVELIDDSLCETSAGNIKEDATDIQNSLVVHDSVSRDKSESKHVDSDMNNHTAVDLGDTCEVNVDETLVNPPKDAVEQLSAMDTVDVDTSHETSAGNIGEDSVSRDKSESKNVDSDMKNHTAVDLGDTCEVNVNKTSVNPPKDAVEQLSPMDTVDVDTSHETSAGNIEEDSVSGDKSESKHVDSDMNNHTAVDLGDTCEVNVNETSVNPRKDAVEQLSAMDTVDYPSHETSAGNIEEDSVSGDKSESKHVDSDMKNHTAVDLGDTCEVNVNETSVNPPKDAVEQLSAMDTVEQLSAMDTVDVDTSHETSAGNIEEDATAIQNPVPAHDSVSLGECESIHNCSDMSNDTAVDLYNTCEVKVNDTFVNSPKDSVEQLSTTKTVNEDLAAKVTITLCKGGNVVDNTYETDEKVTCVEPVMNSFKEKVTLNNADQAIGEGPTVSSFATDVAGDERIGDLKNPDEGGELGDAQEVDVKVASV